MTWIRRNSKVGSKDLVRRDNVDAQLKWAGKGQTESATKNLHRSSKIPSAGVGTPGQRHRNRLNDSVR